MAKKGYDASAVRALSGLEIIQNNISMYVGGSASDGVFTIVREPADNCVDEALVGRNNLCHIKVTGAYKGSAFIPDDCFVIDNGTGIPVEKTSKNDPRTALEIVTSHIHGGAKFKDAGAYDSSRGTHGVGIKATNALSEFFNVYTFRNKKWYVIQYAKAKMTGDTHVATKKEITDLEKAMGSKVPKQGTIIWFKPDLKQFDKGSNLPLADLRNWTQMSAYFNSKVKFILEYPTHGGKKGQFDKIELCYKDGMSEYLQAKLKENKATPIIDEHILLRTKHVDMLLAFSDADGCKVEGYTNTLYNSNGGSHLKETFIAISEALEKYAGKHEYNVMDLREGLVGVINFKIDTPKFASQTKERLSDARFEELCYDEIYNYLVKYFRKHKDIAEQICERAAKLREIKNKFALNKKVAAKLKPKRGQKSLLPGKLTEVKNCPVNEREIFTVEGDSAGGTADAARMNKPYRYQETLALKGKIANAAKLIDQGKGDAVWESEEVLNILTAIGFNPSSKDPMKDLRCGKLILTADADPDGGHINTLVLTTIAELLPEMFTRGMVYIAILPKYMAEHKGTLYFGNTVKEIRAQAPKGVELKPSYLKGLGEMSALALRQCAFDPETRKLYKINAPSRSELGELHELMGSSAEYRKKLLGIAAD
ncbi:DNA topoisomerase 2 [Vibrio phage vB_VcorM_GR7B]|nr:DNA topoisomerase 2 [Vibrio phage vB_VcorM_GR7B]